MTNDFSYDSFMYETHLRIFHQPNTERFTTQAILANDMVFICFCLSYDNHEISHVISYMISYVIFVYLLWEKNPD